MRKLYPITLACLLAASGGLSVPAAANTPGTVLAAPSWWQTWLPNSLNSFLGGNLFAAFWSEPRVPAFGWPQPDASPCLVLPLAPLEDAEALSFEEGQTLDIASLTPATARALTRFEMLVERTGGRFALHSAFRPPAYQQHLAEVWDKWMVELRHNTDPSCQPLRMEVQEEFIRHELLESQRPAAVSDHMRGLAFDAAVYVPRSARWKRRRATLDTLARAAGLHRPLPRQDWVHYRLLQ